MSIPEICNGCSQLRKKKPIHGYQDYVLDDDMQNAGGILVLNDSFRWNNGITPVEGKELSLLLQAYEEAGIPESEYPHITHSACIKCPYVAADDMSTNDMKICRTHLENTIKAVNPKFIICFGNVSMKMLLKKSGIMSKRGSLFDYNGIPVMPTYSPIQVIREPKYRDLFIKDISNAYRIFKDGSGDKGQDYTIVKDERAMTALTDLFKAMDATNVPVAVDLETTGFEFNRDRIRTIGISWRDPQSKDKQTYVILSPEEVCKSDYRNPFMEFVDYFLTSPKFKKIFHNAKFDLKFFYHLLYKDGRVASMHAVKNVACTKILAKFVDENKPNSLSDLVKEYFGVVFNAN